jgi:hypothetical protein
MKYHTTMRSFDEGAFCSADDLEEWKATVRGGLVFGLAAVHKLRFDQEFLFEHFEDTQMFQESQPYHSKQLN